jgi:arsenite methyltransferase
MTDVSTTLPPALSRALDLLIEPPSEPDVSHGYLDLLDTAVDGDVEVAKNDGAIQAAWASPIGSFLYDNAQALTRRFIAAWQLPIEWLNIPEGGVALDVGAGPGSITTSLAHAAGPDGLALGVDISEPMLTRAVRAAAGPQVGLLRADAQRLPLRDRRRRSLDRGVAADPRSGGGAVGDRPRAEARRSPGGDGPDFASAD